VKVSTAQTMVVDAEYLDQVLEIADELPLELLLVLGPKCELPRQPFEVRWLPASEARPEKLRSPYEANAWDTAAVLFTSGTTGPSKGVVVPWGLVYSFASRLYPSGSLTADDIIYVPTASSHIGGKALPMLAALLGAQIVIRGRFSASAFWDEIRHFGCTAAALVGTMAAFLTKQGEPGPADRDHPLRQVAMTPLADGEGFARRFGVRVCSFYGTTEVGFPLTTGWDIRDWHSCGRLDRTFPGYEVRLVDEHDIAVPTGTPGELIVRTAEPWTLNAGYLGMPEQTASAWRNGWFHTGDLLTRDEQGNHFYLDRLKDAIRRRGENISSFEVESYVSDHPDVLECAAIGVRSELAEEEVKVFVVPDKGRAIAPLQLHTFLASRMPKFMLPRFIEIVDRLPKTAATERVKKHELRALGITPGTWDQQAFEHTDEPDRVARRLGL